MATSKSTAKKPATTKTASGKTAATGKTTKALTGKTTAKKPTAIVKKPATPLAKAAAPAKKTTTPAKKPTSKAPTPEQRYRMIQEAAYYLAEKNGFAGGAMDYWIAAEAEIEVMFSGKKKK